MCKFFKKFEKIKKVGLILIYFLKIQMKKKNSGGSESFLKLQVELQEIALQQMEQHLWVLQSQLAKNGLEPIQLEEVDVSIF